MSRSLLARMTFGTLKVDLWFTEVGKDGRVRNIREAFEQAGYTVDGVRELLGPVAGGALARDEIVPALRATAGGSPLEIFTRLFWLHRGQAGRPGTRIDSAICGERHTSRIPAPVPPRGKSVASPRP